MVKTRTIHHDLFYDGQTVCVPVENIQNNTGVTAQDVIVKLKEIPEGLTYSSAYLGRGQFDINTNIWNIGSIAPLEKISGNMCFVVSDASKAPFNFTFTVGLSEYCDTCEEENSYCVVLNGLSCQDLSVCGYINLAPGYYDDDSDAASSGVLAGQYYQLSDSNLYGLPEGIVKQLVMIPSLTPTPSVTSTPSATPSPTPSVTPSITPTVTPTATVTPTVTPSSSTP